MLNSDTKNLWSVALDIIAAEHTYIRMIRLLSEKTDQTFDNHQILRAIRVYHGKIENHLDIFNSICEKHGLSPVMNKKEFMDGLIQEKNVRDFYIKRIKHYERKGKLFDFSSLETEYRKKYIK